MKVWTRKDYVFYIGSIVLTYAIVRVAMLCSPLVLSTLASLAVITLLPFLCSFFVTRRMKKRGKGVWMTVAVPALFDLLWSVMALHLSFAAKIGAKLTGHYNIESTGFFLLFAILFCSGILAGALLGCLLPCQMKNK